MFVPSRVAFAALSAMVVVGCSDPIAGPQQLDRESPPEFAALQTLVNGYTEVCHTMGFSEFEHGDQISTIALPAPFGFNLSVAVASNAGGLDVARAFDVEAVVDYDPDLRVPAAGGNCSQCEGLGRMLVIEDSEGFNNEGDASDGGTITFSGFSGNGTFLVKEFKVVDVHVPEGPLTFWVDGNLDATSSDPPPAAESTVETVTTGGTTFTETMAFVMDGSGAIDDIELCMQVPTTPGDEGCTPGYWKTHSVYAPGNQADSWGPTGWDADDPLTDAFSEAAAYAVGGRTLHQALDGGGGPGAEGGARILARAAVAALLNAAHPDVAYPRSEASVISDVNAAFASGNRNTMLALAAALDLDNNLGCSL